MEIEIKYCNNINDGKITIFENRLNVKYALNGTGKTTISKAIELSLKGDNLDALKPFAYTNIAKIKPAISGLPDNCKCIVFNENYVGSYVFQPDEIIKNSFEIFIKTPAYEKNQKDIADLISKTKDLFKEDSVADNLLKILNKYIDDLKPTKTGYSKAGVFGKGLAKGNKVSNIPDELNVYEPFIKSKNSVDWLSWQQKGTSFNEISNDICPYCSNTNFNEKKKLVKKLNDTYDSKYVKHIEEMLSVLKQLEPWLSEDANNKIESIKSSAIGLSDEQENFISQLNEQINLLIKKLNDLRNLSYETIKNLEQLEADLNNKQIQIEFLGYLNSEKMKNQIDIINESIKKTLENVGQLKGAVNKEKQEIAKNVGMYEKEINDFLSYAGYSYEVKIGENYTMHFNYKGAPEQILDKEINSSLSYGERNAFALVLFMYDALDKNPDLVILDDPISSFDNDKKFAILHKLFTGQNSLNKKTVLLLTHDFSTIIDTKKVLSDIFQPKCYFLTNINNELFEKEIKNEDMKACNQIFQSNIENSNDLLIKLIFLRRLLEILGKKNSNEYEIVSNVFHKRETPQRKLQEQDFEDMSEFDIKNGTEAIIKKYGLKEFDYNEVLNHIKDNKKLIGEYRNQKNGYLKLQYFRLIFDETKEWDNENGVVKKYVNETYHIENENLFQLNPLEFETVPDYIIKICDRSIDKYRLPCKTNE